MNLSSCHAKTAKTITNSYKQKLLFITCGPLNFHFSNWWIWPSPNVNTTLDQEQERDKWNIITILNAREMPRSFLSLWTHLSLFSACTPSRLPVALCYCCWNSSAPLTTVNAQLVFECRTRPLSLGFLPPFASLCFWVDIACSLVLNVLKPGGARSWADAKAFRDAVLFEASKDVAGWHAGSLFTWLSLCSRPNRMHGRGGAKWAAIPSLTLVEQKMSHASSQS